MPAKEPRIPKYRFHKASGQAAVVLDGSWIYLGPYEDPASREKYDRVIAEWLGAGRSRVPEAELSVGGLMLAYWEFAETYYRKGGRPTSELHCIQLALRVLRRLYGCTPAVGFGPKALKTVREEMIRMGWSRSGCNKAVGRIKRMFRWGVENELVPASVYQALAAVTGLRRGRCAARETEPVRPVPDSYVDAILPYVTPEVAAMIQIQRLTGMRPDEVVHMRGVDIDMTDATWVYRRTGHKTEHFGYDRWVLIGPRAQAVVRGYLKPDVNAYLFSPREAEARRNAARRADRRTPRTPSQEARRPRLNRTRPPQERYSTASYRRAIHRGCDRADLAARMIPGAPHGPARLLPRWSPNRLRHNFATWMRREAGLEVTRILLGHQSAVTSEIYAEKDRALAADKIGRLG